MKTSIIIVISIIFLLLITLLSILSLGYVRNAVIIKMQDDKFDLAKSLLIDAHFKSLENKLLTRGAKKLTGEIASSVVSPKQKSGFKYAYYSDGLFLIQIEYNHQKKVTRIFIDKMEFR